MFHQNPNHVFNFRMGINQEPPHNVGAAWKEVVIVHQRLRIMVLDFYAFVHRPLYDVQWVKPDEYSACPACASRYADRERKLSDTTWVQLVNSGAGAVPLPGTGSSTAVVPG